MQMVKDLSQVPGRVTQVGDDKIRITDGVVPSPRSLELEVLHEQPGLCAWVGKRTAKGHIADAIPVFIAGDLGNQLTPLTAGAVLLTDLARDLTVENRLAGHNFAIGNVREMNSHIQTTYGNTTERIITQDFLSGQIGTKTAQFLAARFTRILKVNYLDAARLFEQDGTRIRLKTPFKLMTRFDSKIKLADMKDLAAWLGERWIEAETRLLNQHPEVADRSAFFRATADEQDAA